MDNSEVLVVVEIAALHDPETMQSYQARARAQIGQWGGVVLARGSAPYEGAPPFGPVMVQRWPSRQAFVDWQESDDYRPLRDMRMTAADLRIAIVPLV